MAQIEFESLLGEKLTVEAESVPCIWCDDVHPWNTCPVCEGTGEMLVAKESDPNYREYARMEQHMIDMEAEASAEKRAMNRCF